MMKPYEAFVLRNKMVPGVLRGAGRVFKRRCDASNGNPKNSKGETLYEVVPVLVVEASQEVYDTLNAMVSP